MKKYSVLLFALFFISCEGSMGPRGPQGPPGPIGQVFERTRSFNASNEYIQIISIPSSIEIDPSDIVMVYWLFNVNQGTENAVWQPLPASYFFPDGAELQYAFDHTVADVKIYLDGDVALSSLGPGFTQNQTFRIVILPAYYVQANNINLNDMQTVMGLVKGNKVR